MTQRANIRIGAAAVLTLMIVAAAAVLLHSAGTAGRRTVVAYFANSNGIFVGDEVRILGVPVGKIERIEPQTTRVKITFWYDGKYQVPADAKAVILSPAIVSARIIQLTPAYTSGPEMRSGAVIPEDRTAVPVEWDDLRQQLERLTRLLQPDEPGGLSTLGSVVHTTADALRGQGANIRATIVKLSQAVSVLGDHSEDLFGTMKNLSVLVSALQDSGDLMRQLNGNLATATGLLTDEPNEIGDTVTALAAVVGEVRTFVADNRESLGSTADKLASVSTVLTANLDDIKQTLHIAPNELQNLMNIYQPAQGTLGGAYAFNNFADPITFLCGAIQAASRLGAEQSAKLCAQYLAPIVKNRQYNFPPLAENLIVGVAARPNEVTYSEDWMRPDYVPPPAPNQAAPASDSPLPAEVQRTDPAAGLTGMMMPGQGG
ncbi:MCE family protein [Candidatus Mycolicibacterium alkanivorans]|uniref:MCE family protein n=1 Tax=Candidatus Mycolicibacterium alkanivorans TaxID=2954114 RepID=A0ABS9YT45_9MYCO|nr:MCE family protein [Candidatus Mycolicibacterium alkanivorans]MCI4673999.1 MCE family protein [Candidatus Mycolicibacterium alkanivorans]